MSMPLAISSKRLGRNPCARWKSTPACELATTTSTRRDSQRAHADQTAVALRVHVGGAQVPEQLAAAPARAKRVGKRRRQIAMIHPALQHARAQAIDRAQQAERGRQRNGRARAAEGQFDAGATQIAGQCVMRAQRNDVLGKPPRAQGAGELHQHGLGAARSQPRNDMQHVDHAGGPATSASWVNSAASS